MIRIGTDCSGIEAPIQALLQLGVDFKHVFACESDKYAVQSIKANYLPEVIYDDITTRDHALLPDIDMYVCGFPCQPFSSMGNKLGTNDPRGNIMNHCIEVIKLKLPDFFILENVKNFKYIDKSKPYNYLTETLNEIGFYDVYIDLLNTKHYGLPQNRERLFIIGIKKSTNKVYNTPERKEMIPLDDIILDKTIRCSAVPKTILKKLEMINFEENYILCCDSYSKMKGLSSTLTKSGCKYMFHSTYKRYLLPEECLLLQGFPRDFKNVVGDNKLCNQIGNSMSVNVLMEIFKVLL